MPKTPSKTAGLKRKTPRDLDKNGPSQASTAKAPRVGKQSLPLDRKPDAILTALAESVKRQSVLYSDSHDLCERFFLSERVTLALQRQTQAKEALRLLDEEVTVCQAFLLEHRKRDKEIWAEVHIQAGLEWEQHAFQQRREKKSKAEQAKMSALRKEKEELRKRMADIDKALKDVK